MINLKVILAISKKEFINRIKNISLFILIFILAILSFAISYFGTSPFGLTGYHGTSVTIASLMSLSIYLIPLISFILGYDSITGEEEDGTMPLLLSSSASRSEIYLGKFIGLTIVISIAVFVGYGISGVIILLKESISHITGYFTFVFSSVLLGISFLSIALLISSFTRSRTASITISVFLWFFYIFIYDLLLIGILVATKGNAMFINNAVIGGFLLVNPADVYRLFTISFIQGLKGYYGLTSILTGKFILNRFLLIFVYIMWIFLPMLSGMLIFYKKRY
ncbi:MAG: ABC transporter permease [Deltaproteobacteria bacterium]|nr:ABC transporter permease [Deltaproteobacteria bacterium]MCL5892577.1 ABC transporter permease [Deltaproteobacteria bacterium]